MQNIEHPIQRVCDIESLKLLDATGLTEQARLVREFLIESVSKTGGHIGANLAVVELTIAIHYLFNSPDDKIIFDTGHQGYTHKLLTGRKEMFSTLNNYGGMSRFIARSESQHDIIDATHAGTSLSIASGLIKAINGESLNDHNQHENYVVAVIGDGSLVEGMAFEGLNYCAKKGSQRLVIIINDNEMAIAPSVGGMRQLTTSENWKEKSASFFQGLGFHYIAIEEGHDIPALLEGIGHAKEQQDPVVVHVKTEKGKGLDCAKSHPYKMHFSMPFDADTGKGASPTITGKTYAVVAANKLQELMQNDDKLYAITPATPYASSLDELFALYPDRVLDVGMAEQQAVGMACGLALGGKHPIVCMQTTFMQRAFDQLLHDVCYMSLPVTVLGVRAGFAGYDGATHHGLYDLPYLRSFPNLQIIYPASSEQLERVIESRLSNPKGPMVILYPYEPIPKDEVVISPSSDAQGMSLLHHGEDGMIITLGNRVDTAMSLQQLLKSNEKDFGVLCVHSIKPLNRRLLLESIAGCSDLITLEESVLNGGFGSLILETISDADKSFRLLRSGVDDCFVEPGSKNECSRACFMQSEQIMDRIISRWPDYKVTNQ